MALQNLRSSTPSKRPDASSMSDGQIALNTAAASAGLFFKDSNGDLVKTGPVHIGTTAPNSTPATGGSTGNSKGEAWLDTSNGNYVLKIYDGTAWRSVEIAAGSARQLLQTNAAGTDVEFTSNVDVPGTLDVTGATTLDSTASVAGLLSANGKISFAEGNAAAPGIYPGSDTDTGISSPSLNELSISTAGTSRLYIDSSGDVGIGTSNPFGRLNVSRNDGAEGLEITPTISSVYLQTYDRNSLQFVETRSIASQFRWDLGATEAMRIDSNGNVGIGTSSPANPLTVAGTSGTGANAALRIEDESAQAVTIGVENDGDVVIDYLTKDLTFSANGNEKVRIDSSGNVGIGTSSPAGTLNVLGDQIASPSRFYDVANILNLDYGNVQLAFGVDPNSPYGCYIQGRDSTNTARPILLNAAGGNVGIGTSNPGQRLVVSEGGAQGLEFNPFTSDRFVLAGYNRSTSQYIQLEYEGSNHLFKSGTSEKVRITSSGNVGIGTSNPSAFAGDCTLALSATGGSRLAFNATGRNYYIAGDSGSDRLEIGRRIASNTADSPGIVLDSTGNVGINTSSPGSKLSIKDGDIALIDNANAPNAGHSIRFFGADVDDNSTNYAEIKGGLNNYIAGQTQSGYLTFSTSGNERMRITSGGQVGVGTSSPIARVTALGINGGGEGGTMCIQNTASGVNTNVALYLTPNNGGGNDLQRSAAIRSRQEVAGNYANLEFYTSQSATPAERMRISSSGVVRIGQTTSDDPSGSNVRGVAIANGYISAAMDNGNAAVFGRRGSNGGCVLFRRQTTNVGSITVNGSSTSYNTTSDHRLKENVVDIADGITRVKQLAPKRFNFIVDADTTVDGFLAHEAQAVVPEAVTGTHNEVDDEGNPVMQGIDQSKLVPLLTAALQEAITKIETLEQRLTDAGL